MKKDGRRTHAAVLLALEKETYPVIKPTTKAKDVTAHDIKIILAQMIRRGADTQSNRVRSYLMAASITGSSTTTTPPTSPRTMPNSV